MKNGNYIKGIPASEKSRGHKVHISYLEPGIKGSEFFEYGILPAIFISNHKKG